MQLSEAALTRIEPYGDLAVKSAGSGHWSWRAICLGCRLKMIFIETLPEKIIVQTKH
jgi:hypothetical protein